MATSHVTKSGAGEPDADPFKPREFNIETDGFGSVIDAAMGATLQFKPGRPQGMAAGVALLFTKQVYRMPMFPLKTSAESKTEYGRPPEQFRRHGSLMKLLKSVLVLSGVDISYANPTAYVMTFPLGWTGYQPIFDALAVADENNEALVIRYIAPPGGGVGRYTVEREPLTAEQKKLRASIQWPTADDLDVIFPPARFSQLLASDANLRREWAKIQREEVKAAEIKKAIEDIDGETDAQLAAEDAA